MTEIYYLLSAFFGGIALTSLVAYFIRRSDLDKLTAARATRDDAIGKWNTVSASLFEARLERDTATVARNTAMAEGNVVVAERDLVIEELERTAWSLGGRLRGRDEPPLYIMPPGQKHEASCDVARMAWMDTASDAAQALRGAGLDDTADKFHPASVRANQWGAQTQGAPSVADARKM